MSSFSAADSVIVLSELRATKPVEVPSFAAESAEGCGRTDSMRASLVTMAGAVPHAACARARAAHVWPQNPFTPRR